MMISQLWLGDADTKSCNFPMMRSQMHGECQKPFMPTFDAATRFELLVLQSYMPANL